MPLKGENKTIYNTEQLALNPRVMAQHARQHSEVPISAPSQPLDTMNNFTPARPVTQQRPNNSVAHNERRTEPPQDTMKVRAGAPRTGSESRYPLQSVNPAVRSVPGGASGKAPTNFDPNQLKVPVPPTMGLEPPRALKHQASDSTENSLRSRGRQMGGHSIGQQTGVQVRIWALIRELN
jgi:hypothetical protein